MTEQYQTYELIFRVSHPLDFNDIQKIMSLPIMNQLAYPLYLFRENVTLERLDYADAVDQVLTASEFRLKQEHIDALFGEEGHEYLLFSTVVPPNVAYDEVIIEFHPRMLGAWARGETLSPEFVFFKFHINAPLKLQPLLGEEFLVKFIFEIIEIVSISDAVLFDVVRGEMPLWLQSKVLEEGSSKHIEYMYNGLKLKLKLGWITYLSKEHADAVGRDKFCVLENDCKIIEREQGLFIVVKAPFSRLNKTSFEKLRKARKRLAETT